MIRMFNTSGTDMTGKMQDASLPVVYAMVGDTRVNMMHGITGNLEVRTIRNALSVLSDDRRLSIEIDTFGGNIATVSYEVRSIDGERLIERNEVLDYIEQNNSIRAKLNIKDLIKPATEYMLVILIDNGSFTARYYTRIIYAANLHEEETVDFVTDFSEKTFDKKEAQELVTYLESNSMGDNSTYDHVNINSSFDQITWGSLRPKPPVEKNVTILDMDGYTSAYLIDYSLGINDETYRVREYYRLRFTEKRIYLLDFERDMNEEFTEEERRFINDKIILGIRNENVNMEESADGGNLAFEQNGGLYMFKQADRRLVRIFSFEKDQKDDRVDIRNTNDDHRIKILRVGENGSVYYAVYGYMNRGRHEGDTGISVCYYDSSLNQTEEQIYINYPYSHDRLFKDIDTLFFHDGGAYIDAYLAGSIYKINIEERKVKELAQPEELVVSESNRTAAVLEEGHLRVLDFYSGKELDVDTKGAHPLGFVGEDFVYGVAEPQDVVWSIFGSSIEPMRTVYIENNRGDILKTFSRPGVYVLGAEIGENEISLKCVSKAGERLVTLPDEEIMHNSAPEKKANTILRVATEDRETITEIELPTASTGKLQLVTPKEVLYNENRNVVIKPETEYSRLYTYAKGMLVGAYTDPVTAIADADGYSGVVVDEKDCYIWRKGKSTGNSITDISLEEDAHLAQTLNAVLLHTGVSMDTEVFLDRGENALEILGDHIDGTVLSLSGSPLSEVLYYVSIDSPVLVSYQSRACLITSYDVDSITMMDGNGTEKLDMKRAAELFESSGNDFVSYVLKTID